MNGTDVSNEDHASFGDYLCGAHSETGTTVLDSYLSGFRTEGMGVHTLMRGLIEVASGSVQL
jgi:hypothetical protein